MSTPVDNMSDLMRKQAQLAIEQADLVLFIVDGRAGLMPTDNDVAQQLRNHGKPIRLVINKTEGEQREIVAAEFYRLGLGEPLVISATQGRGFDELLDEIKTVLPEAEVIVSDDELVEETQDRYE